MIKRHSELLRYGVNGLAATAVHFAILTFNLKVLNIPSAGLANMIAAAFGILISFLGSRYFVFEKNGEGVLSQAIKFGSFYSAIALLHGFVLFLWTDRMGFDYQIGFALATILQISMSYIGNKYMVFKK